MEKKISKARAIEAYKAISNVPLKGLDKEVAFAVLRASNALRGTAKDFEEFISDARERLKPEGFDDRVAEGQRFDSLPEERRKALNKFFECYEQNVQECVAEELKKEVTLDIPTLSEDGIVAIGMATDLTAGTLGMLGEVCS